ncbi:DUF2726 domain-containing protein [Pseudomonas duriflava]|nr:DUF2726 domain-containing protein [Pseudomonas duriflava]
MLQALSAHSTLLWGVAAGIVLLLVIKFKLSSTFRRDFPYVLNEALFTPAERNFLRVLDSAVDDDYRVFGKVRIADVASVTDMRDQKRWYRAFNKISAKHFDYVLCDPEDLSFVAVIELDDKSHERADRQERDVFVEGVCKAINLPLIRIPARATYSTTEVRSEILDALRERGASRPRRKKASQRIAPSTATPVCSRCASPMVRRQARSGANAGEAFWGCSAFPTCRHVKRINE